MALQEERGSQGLSGPYDLRDKRCLETGPGYGPERPWGLLPLLLPFST